MTTALWSSVNAQKRDTSLLVLGQTWIRVAQLTVVIVLVRVLPRDAWNHVALAFSMQLALVTIGSFNLKNSVLYFLPTLSSEEANALLGRTVQLLALIGAVIGIGTAVGTGMMEWFTSPTVGLLLGCAIACELPTVLSAPILISREQTRRACHWDLFDGTVTMISVIGPALLGLGPRGIIAGFASGSVLRLCVFIMTFHTSVPFGQFKSAPMRQLLRRQLWFCAPLGLAMAAGVLTRSVDKWMVAWKIPEKVGMFVLAAQEVPVLAVLPYAGGAVVANALVRHFRSGDVHSSFKIWRSQVELMCVPVVGVSFLMLAIAPEGFTFIFGNSNAELVVCFQVFTLIGLHRVAEYGAVLRAVGHTRDVMTSSFLLLFLNTVFGVLGLVLGGVVGLTVGSLVAYLSAWLWMLWRIKKIFSMSFRKIFPWKLWLCSISFFATIALFVDILAKALNSLIITLVLKTLVFFFALRVATLFSSHLINQSSPNVPLEPSYEN